MIFGLYKSAETRRQEALVQSSANLIRERLHDACAILSAGGKPPSRQYVEDRVNSNFFTGYLVGFAECLISGMGVSEPTRGKLYILFHNTVVTGRATTIAQKAMECVEQDDPDFVEGFQVGWVDCRTFTETQKPTFAHLANFFMFDKDVAA